MRVALMTWFQYHNYGTALQLFSLYRELEELGHDVSVVNYYAKGSVERWSLETNAYQLAKEVLAKVVRIFSTRPYEPAERESLFESFITEELAFTNPCPTMAELEMLNDSYDAFVCGSDQIWAPILYDPHYFLDYVSDGKLKIAFAPSVGLAEVADPPTAARMGKLAARIDYLSTREESGSRIISDLCGREVETVLDPTLLHDMDWWMETARCHSWPSADKPYMLVYMLGNDEGQWRRIRSVAEALELDLKIIPVFTKDLKRSGCVKRPIGPREFLRLIAGASYVCTDSFHGVAFAVNFEKEFIAFERFKASDAVNQNSRVYNILEKLGLRERLWTSGKGLTDVIGEIDWGSVQAALARERESSISFLRNALMTHCDDSRKCNHVFRDRSLCCGCGACVAVCPTEAMSLDVDGEGFLHAAICEELCVSCGRCRSVCPLVNIPDALEISSGELFSYKDYDARVLMGSSSGGAASRLAESSFGNGMCVTGCFFDKSSAKAKHVIVCPGDADELNAFKGSKYLQSDFAGAARWIFENDGVPVAVFGTPCQIAAARNLAVSDNVLLVDLICHGVPTRNLLLKYIDYLHRRDGFDGEVEIVFRHKPRGWHRRHIMASDSKKSIVRNQDVDPFFLMYEFGICYNRSCFECPWRAKSSADVRLGDFWGERFKDDETGVNMVVALTGKGRRAVACLGDYGLLQPQPISDYSASQQMENVPEPGYREDVLHALSSESALLEDIVCEYVRPLKRRRDLYSFMRKVKGFFVHG